MMSVSRRSFLLGTSAALLVPTFPFAPAMATPVAARPALLAYAVGTPGEYDWQAIFARSPEDAFQEWVWSYHGDDDDAPKFDPDFVYRVSAWDGKASISPADWLNADMGHCCERCSYETDSDSGGRVVAGEVVCEECLTIGDRCECDPDDVVEDLADRIASKGEEEVKAWLVRCGWGDEVPDDIWQRAVAAAAMETA